MEILFTNYKIETKSIDQTLKVFDIVRKRWFVLTPEEQVRQIWLHYLINDLRISPTKIAVEKGLKINNRNKRFDICVYNDLLKPFILIECKAPNILLSQPNFEQLSRYNIELSAEVFVVTNGLQHIGYRLENNQIHVINNLPLTM